MSSDFLELEAWAQATLAALGPGGRRRLQQQLARDLRRSQADRIAAQQNPDGTPFEPRKEQAAEASRFRARAGVRDRAGQVRRRASPEMFRRIRTAAFLRGGIDDEGVWVGFSGRVARIAAVHQEGEVDRVSPDGPKVRYPVRALLGFTEAEKRHILDLLVAHVDV